MTSRGRRSSGLWSCLQAESGSKGAATEQQPAKLPQSCRIHQPEQCFTALQCLRQLKRRELLKGVQSFRQSQRKQHFTLTTLIEGAPSM